MKLIVSAQGVTCRSTTQKSENKQVKATMPKMRARTFAVGLMNRTIQPTPQGSIPAIPLPLLQEMVETDSWPANLSNYLV